MFLFRKFHVEKFALAAPRFEHRLAEFLVKTEPAIVEREFHVVALGPMEVGLRYENGVLAEVLAPNTRRLYFKGYIDLRFERIDIANDFEVGAKLVPQLVAFTGNVFQAKVAGADGVYGVQVPQFHVGVLYVDGKLEAVLDAGLRAFWRFGRDVRVEFVDLRMQVIEVAGQEILTKDKVPLRVNLNAGYRVTDVRVAFAKQAKPVDYLYKELHAGHPDRRNAVCHRGLRQQQDQVPARSRGAGEGESQNDQLRQFGQRRCESPGD